MLVRYIFFLLKLYKKRQGSVSLSLRTSFANLNVKHDEEKAGYELTFKSFLLSREMLKHFSHSGKKEPDGIRTLVT